MTYFKFYPLLEFVYAIEARIRSFTCIKYYPKL